MVIERQNESIVMTPNTAINMAAVQKVIGRCFPQSG
jgi:hypothetical protein